MFADEGALFKRLLHRFLHIATVSSIPEHLALDNDLRIYFEADSCRCMHGACAQASSAATSFHLHPLGSPALAARARQ
ncbi:MAG: hypothetical protein ABS87_01355 [Sphingomonas sp. SCN 67-18]|nr:MAG: hypothetical protein ABS87_01355 [Sphingomonas sp. SCN 67-18]